MRIVIGETDDPLAFSINLAICSLYLVLASAVSALFMRRCDTIIRAAHTAALACTSRRHTQSSSRHGRGDLPINAPLLEGRASSSSRRHSLTRESSAAYSSKVPIPANSNGSDHRPLSRGGFSFEKGVFSDGSRISINQYNKRLSGTHVATPPRVHTTPVPELAGVRVAASSTATTISSTRSSSASKGGLQTTPRAEVSYSSRPPRAPSSVGRVYLPAPFGSTIARAGGVGVTTNERGRERATSLTQLGTSFSGQQPSNGGPIGSVAYAAVGFPESTKVHSSTRRSVSASEASSALNMNSTYGGSPRPDRKDLRTIGEHTARERGQRRPNIRNIYYANHNTNSTQIEGNTGNANTSSTNYAFVYNGGARTSSSLSLATIGSTHSTCPSPRDSHMVLNSSFGSTSQSGIGPCTPRDHQRAHRPFVVVDGCIVGRATLSPRSQPIIDAVEGLPSGPLPVAAPVCARDSNLLTPCGEDHARANPTCEIYLGQRRHDSTIVSGDVVEVGEGGDCLQQSNVTPVVLTPQHQQQKSKQKQSTTTAQNYKNNTTSSARRVGGGGRRNEVDIRRACGARNNKSLLWTSTGHTAVTEEDALGSRGKRLLVWLTTNPTTTTESCSKGAVVEKSNSKEQHTNGYEAVEPSPYEEDGEDDEEGANKLEIIHDESAVYSGVESARAENTLVNTLVCGGDLCEPSTLGTNDERKGSLPAGAPTVRRWSTEFSCSFQMGFPADVPLYFIVHPLDLAMDNVGRFLLFLIFFLLSRAASHIAIVVLREHRLDGVAYRSVSDDVYYNTEYVFVVPLFLFYMMPLVLLWTFCSMLERANQTKKMAGHLVKALAALVTIAYWSLAFLYYFDVIEPDNIESRFSSISGLYCVVYAVAFFYFPYEFAKFGSVVADVVRRVRLCCFVFLLCSVTRFVILLDAVQDEVESTIDPEWFLSLYMPLDFIPVVFIMYFLHKRTQQQPQQRQSTTAVVSSKRSVSGAPTQKPDHHDGERGVGTGSSRNTRHLNGKRNTDTCRVSVDGDSDLKRNDKGRVTTRAPAASTAQLARKGRTSSLGCAMPMTQFTYKSEEAGVNSSSTSECTTAASCSVPLPHSHNNHQLGTPLLAPLVRVRVREDEGEEGAVYGNSDSSCERPTAGVKSDEGQLLDQLAPIFHSTVSRTDPSIHNIDSRKKNDNCDTHTTNANAGEEEDNAALVCVSPMTSAVFSPVSQSSFLHKSVARFFGGDTKVAGGASPQTKPAPSNHRPSPGVAAATKDSSAYLTAVSALLFEDVGSSVWLNKHSSYLSPSSSASSCYESTDAFEEEGTFSSTTESTHASSTAGYR